MDGNADESTKEGRTVQEGGVSITVEANHNNPTKCKVFYNPVMQICRELVLCSLSAYTETKETSKCLDAFAASGIGGLQWKHHLKDKVEVTLNELSSAGIEEIQKNCKRNGFECHFLSKREDNTAGDGQFMELVQGDANVIMHQQQFDFIHLDPFGSTVQFLDSAFRNIYNKGVMVITCTDVAVLYNKCPLVLRRNYDAHLVNADYLKEMAARIILAAAARAAARCNKGFEVLYTIAVEHFIQVAVRICRGPSFANTSITQVRKVLQCSLCHECAVYPDTRTPIDHPYSLLPCNCNAEVPGKTGVELGPMWCASIFDSDYLECMLSSAFKLNLSKNIKKLLKTVHMESLCTVKNPDDISNNPKEAADVQKIGDSKDIPEPAKKKMKTESSQDIPMFFYNPARKKFKDTALPKADKLVMLLQEKGFRTSRTHFDPMAVRTSATLQQLREVIEEHCNKDSTTPST